MHLIKKYKTLTRLLLLLPLLAFVWTSNVGIVRAATPTCGTRTCTFTCSDGTTQDYDSVKQNPPLTQICSGHGGVMAGTSGDVNPLDTTVNLGDPSGKYQCGGGTENGIKTSINFGCKGQGNPIVDLTFAIIRVLTDGVGLVIVAALIVAGMQLSAAQGDPAARAKAIGRITNILMALLLFIFAYALLNYVIPAGFFK